MGNDDGFWGTANGVRRVYFDVTPPLRMVANLGLVDGARRAGLGGFARAITWGALVAFFMTLCLPEGLAATLATVAATALVAYFNLHQSKRDRTDD